MEDGFANEMNLLAFNLLKRITFLRAQVGDKSPEGSIFNFPKVDELGFIDFLLENLMELTSREDGSFALAKHQIQAIQEGLVFVRPLLGKIVELRNEQEELQALWDRVVEFAYRVEFLIDSFVIGDIPVSSPMPFESILKDIEIIRLDILMIFEELDIKEQILTKTSSHLPLERSTPTIKEDIVVLDDEATSIMDQLKRGADQLQIVAIVGMAGQGKTTLAKVVYNNFSIVSHFHVRAWCCVSQGYDKKKLLLEILSYTSSENSDKKKLLLEILNMFSENSGKYSTMSEEDLALKIYSTVSEEDLALKLYQNLKKKRYLIVLDDVWDIDVWNSLGASFPNDANGSRIILTSRLLDAVPKDKLNGEPHFLRQLTDDESWKLLTAKLFPRDSWPPALFELGKQIVESCKGLPLSIVILAGILATLAQDGWKGVVESLSSSTVSSTEQCKNLLELSYRTLPDKLKSCLLYFGAFAEDQELTTKKLTWLWIGEGFVRNTQSKCLEDEAEDYLMQLISRSLVMVVKKGSTGGVKTCRIHDLLHEFCVEKAKEERFFQLLQGYDELSHFNEPHNLRRLCIYSEPVNFHESMLFCPRVRCLLFFGGDRHSKIGLKLSFIIGSFKLVRVLDLSQTLLHPHYTFPSEIELLTQLRYLAVTGYIFSIPPSVASLLNLETFILHSLGCIVKLPNEIWNMEKLRHLHGAGFSLQIGNLDNSAGLCNLDTFSTAILHLADMEKLLRKFPNIRKLKCCISEYAVASDSESKKFLVLDHLSRLESLHLRRRESLNVTPHWTAGNMQIEFRFPLNLRKLTLSQFKLPWSKISALGNLPNLEVLKLIGGAFTGKVWNMEEAGQFPKIRFLKLADLDIVKWTASESNDHFPCLVKLVLGSCYKLEEVPSFLGDILTLQVIEVSYCSFVENSVKQIQDEQVSMGNEDLKVLISSFKTRST